MVPSNLKVLTKFGLSSNCSQKLDECLGLVSPNLEIEFNMARSGGTGG